MSLVCKQFFNKKLDYFELLRLFLYQVYKSSTNNLSILTSLNELRLENVLCDVVLVVEEDKFVAHRNVLTASSSFFKNLFETNDKASEVCIKTIRTENY